MVLNAPAVVVAHGGEDERGRGEGAVAVAHGGIDPRVAETDDVGAAIAVEVTHDPQMLGPVPTQSRVEVGEHQFRWLEGAVAVAQGGPHTVVPEPDQVGLPVPRQVHHVARVLIDPPALVVAQVRHHELRRLECAVAVAQGGPHTVAPEADEVRLPVSGDVDHESWMLIDAPALVVPQVRHDEFHSLKGAVPVVPGRPDAGIAETDEVGASVPGEIRRQAGVSFVPPPRVETEAVENQVRRLESAAGRVQGGPDSRRARNRRCPLDRLR